MYLVRICWIYIVRTELVYRTRMQYVQLTRDMLATEKESLRGYLEVRSES